MSLLVPPRRFDPTVPEIMDRPGNEPTLLRADLRQCRKRPPVALDGNHAHRALGKKGARQSTRTWADLIHIRAGDARFARDAPGQIEIEDEVLPQTLARREPMRRDHRAQGRQAVVQIRVRHNPRLSAISAAMRMAAIMLASLAIPFPAMPSAVP